MLLTARKILLIHFLMRLPDFVKPVVVAADRFLQRIQIRNLFTALFRSATARRTLFVQAFSPRRRGRTLFRLPRSKTQEG